MRTAKEVSRLSGISTRTLRYYDSIGLLKPSELTDAGYRLYDETAVERLWNILFLKELDFPLKTIASIMDDPHIDRQAVFEDQIKLLKMKKEHIEACIRIASGVKKGENVMNFDEFKNSRFKKYAAEAEKRWGNTSAYKESRQRAENRTEGENRAVDDGLMDIFRKFGKMRKNSPDCPEAFEMVTQLKAYITENYYNCTDEMLLQLGGMYVSDERFRHNIDEASGEGTAVFVSNAIRCFFSK